jgi:hypothetical protein
MADLTEEERSLCLVIHPVTSEPEFLQTLHTPWPLMEGGTYHFNGEWERIDNFFLTGDLWDGKNWEWAGCSVIRAPWMLTSRGTPRSWNSETGEGFSDHLPLLLRLRFRTP